MVRGPDKQFDREEVLQRAMDLFWSKGYEATGMSELIEHMRIGRQSLYNTFGDKRSLFLAALGKFSDMQILRTRAILSQPGSPLGNVESFFADSAKMAEASGDCGCLMGNSMAEFGGRDPEIARILSGHLDRTRAVFEETLERAKEAGELVPDANPADLSRILLAIFQGFALLGKASPGQLFHPDLIKASIQLFRGGPR